MTCPLEQSARSATRVASEVRNRERRIRSKRARALFGSLRETAENVHFDGVRLVKKVAADLFESLSTPISLSCEILLRYNELEQLLKKSVVPSEYDDRDPLRFRDDYQAVSFLKKCPFEAPGIDRRAAALLKFKEAEEQCRATNRRIRDLSTNPLNVDGDVRSILLASGRKIDKLLGTFNSREWLFSCRFGPGVFNHPHASGLTSVYDKLQVAPSVTPDARELGAMLITSSPPWARSITDRDEEGFWPFVNPEHLIPVSGNRVTFVPKTALVDRAIAIEPLVNIYAQLGIGKMIRRRLRRVGIDLNSQEHNQRAAHVGSATGSLATIDLSSASDTVAKDLVSFLFPEGWSKPMDLIRSKNGCLDGEWFRYEKFSSMGNGFTFELESVLFWALSVSVCDYLNEDASQVLVYGDDIVVPSNCYDLLEKVLTFCGFTLNRAKSFNKGVFRESCGKDYYNGLEVRPFFQKDVPQDLSEVLALANGLRRVASRRNHAFGCDGRMRRAWLTAVRAIPDSITRSLLVPAHAGDTDGLVVDWDYAQRSSFVRKDRGWDGWWALRLTAAPLEPRKPSNFLGGVASLLYRCRDGFQTDDYVPGSPRQGRDYVWRLRQDAFYGPWTDLGPWL